MNKPKRPRDTNTLAHMIVGIATGEVEEANTDDGKDPAAVALGRKGGLKGGAARAVTLSPARRKEISTVAAAKRWAKKIPSGA